MKKQAVIIFTRVPLPGQTKTRLQALFTAEECARFHYSVLKDIALVSAGGEWDTYVFYTPHNYRAQIQAIFPQAHGYLPQAKTEFGTRMAEAIGTITGKGYESCLLIGSDIPGIHPGLLAEAFRRLEEADVVIGPTLDRGYYLIGMKQLYEEVFSNQTYGKGNVFEETVNKIQRLGLSWSEMESLRDIDEPEDVLGCWRECQQGKGYQPEHTIRCMKYLIDKYVMC